MDSVDTLFRYYTNKICCSAHPDAPLIEDYRAGDQICSECGLVVGDRVIDVGAEWRTLGHERPNPSRVGGPENPLLNGPPRSTVIGPGRGDASFHESGAPKYQNRTTMSSSDRTLISAFEETTRMAGLINLSETIVDCAKGLLKQMHDGKNLKGQASGAIASACLYIACRQRDVPHTFKEICAVSKYSEKRIGRCSKLIRKALGISVDLITPGDFMSRFCAKLDLQGLNSGNKTVFRFGTGLPYKVERAATHIAQKAVELDIVPGRSPISVAAAAIYMASQASEDKRSHKQIEDIAGVNAGTIRQAYKLMYPHAAKLFPNTLDWQFPSISCRGSKVRYLRGWMCSTLPSSV